jgi:hypothetical protein
VQTNTRSATTFIVPHLRDKRGGAERLTDVRDIYENNANMGARRVREAIFAILPPWFTEQAKQVCNQTIEAGDGTPVPERIARAVDAFGRAGVSKRQLEDKIGLKADKWTTRDIAALEVVFRSLVSGESTRDEEFPSGGGLEEALAESKAAKTPPPEPASDATAVAICPECQQGKHQNCEGQAWDDAADAPGPCACADPAHSS